MSEGNNSQNFPQDLPPVQKTSAGLMILQAFILIIITGIIGFGSFYWYTNYYQAFQVGIKEKQEKLQNVDDYIEQMLLNSELAAETSPEERDAMLLKLEENLTFYKENLDNISANKVEFLPVFKNLADKFPNGSKIVNIEYFFSDEEEMTIINFYFDKDYQELGDMAGQSDLFEKYYEMFYFQDLNKLEIRFFI